MPSKATEAKRLPPVAVLVCHGMGQQVAFEAIDSVVHALADQEQIATQGPRRFATPRLIGWEGEWVARATIVLTTQAGDQQPVDLCRTAPGATNRRGRSICGRHSGF